MNNIMQLVATAMQAVDIRDRMRAAAVSAAYSTAGGIICLLGAGFLLAALWLYLADWYGPLAANLWIGGGLVLIGIIVVVAGKQKQPPPKPAQTALGDIPELQPYVNAVAGQIDELLNKKGAGLQSAAVLAGVGFIVGRLLRR